MFDRRSIFAGAFVVVALFGACDLPGYGDAAPLTQVAFALTEVPDGVACVRLTASGPGRTLTRKFAVVPGASISERLGGVPIGSVTFLAEAFAVGCDDVTASRIPGWVSEQVTIKVSADRLTSLELALHRNGRVRVDLSFKDDPACGPAGSACLAGGACCSGVCQAGTCAAPPDGGATD